MSSNIEPLARELCARDLRVHWPEDEVTVMVERYWPVVASQIEAGLIDDNGNEAPFDFDAYQAAWMDWLERHR